MNRALRWTLAGWLTITPIASAAVPEHWQAVETYRGTPDFSDPHYRGALTQVYQFVDAAGVKRHAYVIICAGDERSKDQPKPPPGEVTDADQPQGDLAAGDDRQHEAEEMSKVKAKRLKGAGLTMMTIGDSDDADDDEDEDEAQPD